jgi:hypothetical protein
MAHVAGARREPGAARGCGGAGGDRHVVSRTRSGAVGVAYYESPSMHEDWTAGAYGTSFDLGSLTRYGPHLRQDVGPISFVSSDVAGLGFQHVDGAIRMGEDVAMRITATLPDRGPMLCRSIERHAS